VTTMADESTEHRTFALRNRRSGWEPGSGFKAPGEYGAYQLRLTTLAPIEIKSRPSQRFSDYATSWERKYSSLVRKPFGFRPIVDEQLVVIGYVTDAALPGQVWLPPARGERGRVEEGQQAIVVGEVPIRFHQEKGSEGRTDSIVIGMSLSHVALLIESGYPAYFDDVAPSGQWALWRQELAPYAVPSWMCSVDGQILALASARGGAGAIAEENPWDYIVLVKELAYLAGKGGMRIIKALRNKAGARAALLGATEKASEDAAALLSMKMMARRMTGDTKAFIPESGMTRRHFEAFQAATVAEKELIVVVRLTNPKSAPLIEKGCKGKPKDLEFLSTAEDGIVTARNTMQIYQTYDKGYFVVGEDRVARRLIRCDVRSNTAVFEQAPLKDAFWTLQKGQVLDRELKKPIVGDYDLMGVIPVNSPGQVVATVGEDWTNPLVNRFRRTVNTKMGDQRVLHGAQDNYGGFRGPAVTFFPDGTAKLLKTEEEVKAFYRSLGRETRAGSYGATAPPSDGVYPSLRAVK